MNEILFGDNRETMKNLAQDGVKVQMCVTSPPYFGLRDYGTATWEGGDPECNHFRDTKISENCVTGHSGMADASAAVGDAIYKDVCKKCGAKRVDQQIGLEETPEAFVENLVDVFRHVREILADDGTLWVNLGDSYYNYRNTNGQDFVKQSFATNRQDLPLKSPSRSNILKGLKNKDLIGVPWMFAFAMRDDGWYLRQDIIWHKPNPMPESVKDRCTKAHEYIFLFSKQPQYYYDYKSTWELASYDGRKDEKLKGSAKYAEALIIPGSQPHSFASNGHDRWEKNENGDRVRRKRSVWTVNTKPYKGAHFATYPEELIEPCIRAGSRFGDIVFDPFMGSGTTAAVAIKNGRQYLGCDLNPDYKELQDQRIREAHAEKPPILEGDPNSLFEFE